MLKYHIESSSPIACRIPPLVYRMTSGIFGRGYGWGMRLLGPIFQDKTAQMVFHDGSIYEFYLGDTYWNRALIKGFSYEAEILTILMRLRDIDYVFLDLGANHGYWSILATSSILGCKEAISVEASHSNFAMLAKNCANNGHRFNIFRNAVFSESGIALNFSTGPHAGRHILKNAESDDIADVVHSITIDSLMKNNNIGFDRKSVIKLDVEGAEIDAMKGFSTLPHRDVLIIYEDHGKDRRHLVTRYMIEHVNMRVFFVNMEAGKQNIVPVYFVGDLDNIKVDHRIGYNFLACHRDSEFMKLLL